MMTDKELLEMAAKAAGQAGTYQHCSDSRDNLSYGMAPNGSPGRLWWNPLADDDHALRLSVKLRIDIEHGSPLDNSRYVCASRCGIEMVRDAVRVVEEFEDDVEVQRAYATRRAIVRAAADIGASL